MPLKDIARSFRDGPLARERLRRRHPHAWISGAVVFAGDPRDVVLGAQVAIAGPCALYVTNGGGLSEARLEIGQRTYIGEFNNIRCAGAPIRIGAHCLISQHVSIIGSNHGTVSGRRIVDQEWSGSGVTIGDDVWVGAGVVVLPGAVIGEGAVIAANSTVRGTLAPGVVAAGSPARAVGYRRAGQPSGVLS